MDAFYASVELLRYPELRGQPVVIGGRSVDEPTMQADGSRRFARLRDYVGRGVVTTSTYEARALGVFSAMGIMKATKLAPDAILLPVDFDSYRKYSRLFKTAVAGVAPVIEDRGIDEIYIDLTEEPGESLTLGSTTTGTLASANAGSETVTTAVTLANGTGLASNYVLAQPTLANVTIAAQAPLTVTGMSGC
jgi:DNA polymerase-4